VEGLISKHIKLLTDLKTVFRNSLMDKIPWQERLIGITGARGVGKTTLLLQHITENYGFEQDVLYVSLDDIVFPFQSLIELADEFVKRGGKWLFIDEIHKYPGWSQELKNIYDTYSDLKVVFTGSSMLDIHKGKADLSRRALVFNMQGLSFREFLQIETGFQFNAYSLTEILENHRDITVSIFQKIKPFQFFDNYLKYGYYPYYLQNKEYYSMRLSNIINQVIETDLPQILKVDIEYINKIKRFLNILANDIPFTPNITSLSNAIGVSWQSVINYMNYLNKADIIRIIFPSEKSIKSLSKPEKVLLNNTNIFYIFKNEISNKGSIRETFFVNQLSYKHEVKTSKKGDFLVDEKYLFEIGGKNKTYDQIAGIQNSFVVADDIEFGFGNKIPLWLFGFIY
jgi:predicted AAA+ superfamily ATPase